MFLENLEVIYPEWVRPRSYTTMFPFCRWAERAHTCTYHTHKSHVYVCVSLREKKDDIRDKMQSETLLQVFNILITETNQTARGHRWRQLSQIWQSLCEHWHTQNCSSSGEIMKTFEAMKSHFDDGQPAGNISCCSFDPTSQRAPLTLIRRPARLLPLVNRSYTCVCLYVCV